MEFTEKPWSQGCSWKILRNCFIDLRTVKRKLQRAIQKSEIRKSTWKKWRSHRNFFRRKKRRKRTGSGSLHAGVGFGIGGVAGHLHKYFPAASDGYMGRLNYVQDVYGDTAACLLIRRAVYNEVHGLDESYAVAFNDVDFCVRVREAGYTNVFTPFAQLYHYESKSRGMEDNPEKQKRFQGEVLRFQARWGDLLAKGDPCTNPNFDIQREDFSLKILPLE